MAPRGGSLEGTALGHLRAARDVCSDLPQEGRRIIFNIQDTSVPCQVLCQALCINYFNHPTDLVTGYSHSCFAGEETVSERLSDFTAGHLDCK